MLDFAEGAGNEFRRRRVTGAGDHDGNSGRDQRPGKALYRQSNRHGQ
jgi:hypothetical protein